MLTVDIYNTMTWQKTKSATPCEYPLQLLWNFTDLWNSKTLGTSAFKIFKTRNILERVSERDGTLVPSSKVQQMYLCSNSGNIWMTLHFSIFSNKPLALLPPSPSGPAWFSILFNRINLGFLFVLFWLDF